MIKGALKVGLAKETGDGTFEGTFVSLSEWDGKLLRIPPGTLHGWRNHTNEIAIWMYHISEKYNPEAPDELRYTLAQVGLDWGTQVK